MTTTENYERLAAMIVAAKAEMLAEALLDEEAYYDNPIPTEEDEQKHRLAEAIIDECEDFFYSEFYSNICRIGPDRLLDAVYKHYRSKTFRHNLRHFLER